MSSYSPHRNSSCSTNNNLLSKPSMLTSYASINSLVNGDGKSKLNNNKSAHDRWICPNDRVLTLRAKLDAGWSVRCLPNSIRSHTPSPTPSPASSMLTLASSPSCPDVSSSNVCNNNNNINNINFQPSNQAYTASNGPISSSCITEEEQSKILCVIERAKQVEIMEKERVNRLNERLRNIKRNVSIDSTGRRDICALCCEKFGFFPFTGKSFECRDCSKLVCSKCMVDQVNPTGATIFYCKICSETREMWKKSGAWFLKTLPTFPLLEKPPGEAYSASISSSPGSLRERRRRKPNFTIETASLNEGQVSKNVSSTFSSDKLQETSSLYVASESDSFSPNSTNSTTSTGSKTNTAVPSCHFTFQDVSVHQSPSASSFASHNSHPPHSHHHHHHHHPQQQQQPHEQGSSGGRRILRSESNSPPPPPAPSSHTPYTGQLYVSSLMSPSSSSLNSLDSTVTVSSMSIHLPPGSPTPSTISSQSSSIYAAVDHSASSPSSQMHSQFTFNAYDINKLNNSSNTHSVNVSPPPAPVCATKSKAQTNKLSFNPGKLLRSPSFRRKVKDKKSNVQSSNCDVKSEPSRCTFDKMVPSTHPGAPISMSDGPGVSSDFASSRECISLNQHNQSIAAGHPVGGSSTGSSSASTMSIGSIRTSPWFQRRQMKNYPNQHRDPA